MHNSTYNEAQRNALCHYKGPAMVFAGPGSGKTKVLTARISYLIKKKAVSPSDILVITYTKDAAISMQQRFLREFASKSMPVSFGTFHSIFFHILKEHYHFHSDCLLSEKDKILIISPIIKEYHLDEYAENLLACISMFKNGISIDEMEFPMEMDHGCFVKIYERYRKCCKNLGKIDFDDMLLLCLKLFKEQNNVLEYWRKRYRFILIDEFQDTNRVQYEIVKLLSDSDENIFVVGDDDQAIYGFRGAKPGIMQDFIRDFPNAKQYFLEANYRSHKEILKVAGKVIGENTNRQVKHIFAALTKENIADQRCVDIRSFPKLDGQYAYIIKRIEEMKRYFDYERMAVIFRTNMEIEHFIPFLEKSQIPYSYKEKVTSPYAAFYVQDIKDYLTLTYDKIDRPTFIRVMNKPERGLRRGSFLKEYVDLQEAEKHYFDCGYKREAQLLKNLSMQLKRMKSVSPYTAIAMIRKTLGYDRYLQVKANGKRELFDAWYGGLNQIQEESRQFKTIRDWVDYLEHGIEHSVTEKKEPIKGIRLVTLHGCKGLEFAYVVIPNVNEGFIPHGKMITKETEEEERRLFYVGITRAETALDILYLTGTKEHPRLPSRFLNVLLDDYSSTSSSNS